MAKPKYDGILEGVHLQPDGELDWARVYLRRGPIFSDRIILTRPQLIGALKAGKTFYVGTRILQMGATFDTGKQLRLTSQDGREVLAVGDVQGRGDQLATVPRL
jgi:hypothetical protein